MLRKMLSSLETFSLGDLHHFKDRLDILIKRKTYADKTALDKRSSHRACVKIMGTAEIEREREFFDQSSDETCALALMCSLKRLIAQGVDSKSFSIIKLIYLYY